MSGSQQLLLGGIPTAVPVDPYFYSVTSLLHGDGTNGGQNNTFLDSSTNNFTITRNGNTTQGSFSPFSQTGWSNFFDGTANGSFTATDSGSVLDLDADFTIEFWLYQPALSTLNAPSGLNMFFSVDTLNRLQFYQDTTINLNINGASIVNSATRAGLNQWCHYAIVRSGSTVTVYLNGTSIGSGTSSYSIACSLLMIGGQYRTGYTNNTFHGCNAYISNFRIVKGTAVYTANFTVPTTPLTAISGTSLLTCQANRFVDSSSNALVLGLGSTASVQPFSPFNPTTAYSTSAIGGSGYFDGSGDYLQVSSSYGGISGTGDYTIRGWFYFDDFTTGADGNGFIYIFGQGASHPTYPIAVQAKDGYLVVVDSANFGASFYSTWNSSGSYTNPFAPKQWVYVNIYRSSGTLNIYANGKLQLSISQANSSPSKIDAPLLGRFTAAGANTFKGYWANFEILNSAATSSTPPTSFNASSGNTQLLLNGTNGAIFDNAAVADYETVGNAQISTSVKKYGTGSMYFDGTGDGLYTPNNTQLTFGTGDFTIEFWVYRVGNSVIQGLFDERTAAASEVRPTIYITTGNLISFYTGGADRITASISQNTWLHIAVNRTAGVTKLYINGTSQGSYTDSNNYLAPTNGVRIGYLIDGYSLNGYIDDIRITKGVGRYPYNFTPPTAEFPNIGGSITLTADPYYEYTTLLLPGNGTNGAQNNTFLDSSTNAFSITRNGNTTQGTFSPFSQTGWGNYFDGSSAWLSVASNAAFGMGTGDATLECWYYPTNSTVGIQTLIDIRTTNTGVPVVIGVLASGAPYAYNGTTYSGGTVANNYWNHIAFVRSGGGSNNCKLYLNGTQVAQFTDTADWGSADTCAIGRNTAFAGEYALGYISNVRVVKGTAVYTGNFTPSTTPLTAISGTSLLTCQSNRFVDNSTNAFAITVNGSPSIQAFSPFNPTAAWSAATNGGSGYFDGSGDYLTIGGNSNLAFGTGDFTIEFWAYINSFASAFQHLYDGRPATTDGSYPTIRLNSATLEYVVGGAVQITGSAVTGSTWNHFVVCRSGASTKMFLNGIQTGSTYADSNNYLNPASRPAIGGWGYNLSGGYSVSGYMGDVRSIKGTALYTANFTPPTAPLTAIANTQLLCNFTNAGIYDATSKNDLETVGNAQISTTQSKFGGSSMYFDGTGDWLAIPATQNIVFGTADFTIEMWVYSGAQSGTGVRMMGNGAGGSWASGKYILTTTTATNPNKFTFGVNNTSPVDLLVSTTTFNDSTWRHVAITRYGNVFRLFVNGIQESTNTSSASVDNGTAVQIRIGSSGISGDADWAGYIDDLRITKGIARYTSNFTPPSTAFLTL